MIPRFHVPMITPQPEGDVIEGRIRVPLRLVRTKEHSNERHEFDKLVRDSIKRWTDWRKQMGWEIASTPKVRGPYEPETLNAQAEKPDWMVYTITARFRLVVVASMPEEDWWFINRRAAMYGVDLWQPAAVETPLAKPKAVIEDDGTPFHDPLEFAAERQRRQGQTQKDLLIGTEDVSDPL